MIYLRPAKSVQGAVTLPVSPDLLFMAALSACAAGRKITIPGAAETDVVKEIAQTLGGLADISIGGGEMTIAPKPAECDPAILLTLPESLLPYRSIYLFMGLGMGKTVVVKSAPQRLLDEYIAQAKRVGITLDTVKIGEASQAPPQTSEQTSEQSPEQSPEQSSSQQPEQTPVHDDTPDQAITGLRATYFDNGKAESSYPSEDDCAALLAFLFGKGEKLTFPIVDYHLSSPLRQLAHAFGFTLNAKQVGAEECDDPIAKRMRFLKSKQRASSEQSQKYIVEADFSKIKNEKNADAALKITVPGDEILAAALVTLKCLVPKGALDICGAPLESWGAQTLSFVKKMGAKVNVSEGAKTSFGACGTISVQKSECAGRKLKCAPIYQFVGQLPCMTVAAAFAEGKSVFRELSPLRLYEPDGLDQLEQALRPLGVRHGEMPDGIVVEGAKDFDGFDMLEPLPAHIAVAFCAAGLKCMGKTSIADDLMFARWPGFEKMVNEICEFRNK